jgi:uncharacterized protein DUF5134
MTMSMGGGPSWLPDFFAGAMLLVAVASVLLIVGSRIGGLRAHTDIDVSHLIMGVAMAGMLVPSLSFGSNVFWRVVFAIACVWFARRTYRVLTDRGLRAGGSHHGHRHTHYPVHLVMVAAMLFMFAVPATGDTDRPPGYLSLSLLFLVALMASVVWELNAVSTPGAPSPEYGDYAIASVDGGQSAALACARALPLAQVAEGCHLVMCVAMGYMLVMML